MKKLEKKMEEFFDIPPSPTSEETALVEIKEPSNEIATEVVQKVDDILDIDLDEDYAASRAKYQELVDKGTVALDNLIEIAKESEQPRAYEVIATLVKNISEVNDKFLALQKQIREIKNGTESPNKVNVDKAIFIGSTAELSKLIRGKEI